MLCLHRFSASVLVATRDRTAASVTRDTSEIPTNLAASVSRATAMETSTRAFPEVATHALAGASSVPETRWAITAKGVVKVSMVTLQFRAAHVSKSLLRLLLLIERLKSFPASNSKFPKKLYFL